MSADEVRRGTPGAVRVDVTRGAARVSARAAVRVSARGASISARGAARVAHVLGVLLLVAAGRARAQDMPDPKEMMRWGTATYLQLDALEYAPGAAGRPIRLDATGWTGGAVHRLWLRAEGEHLTRAGSGAAEAQLLYGRLVSPYWDALLGIRVDRRWGDADATRAHLALGLQGLAPYRFELAPTLFLSRHGDVSARLQASYEALLTQRLIAEPEAELNAALREVPEFGIGRGINDVRLALRLRYEIRRELAPYVGYTWIRRFGGGADLARGEGEPVSDGAFVAGVRVWY
ncbi:MAG TPA: copper resistance protein B [Longimicrobiales bacterium]